MNIKKWKDGTLRFGRRIVVEVGRFDGKPIYAYKITGRLVVFSHETS